MNKMFISTIVDSASVLMKSIPQQLFFCSGWNDTNPYSCNFPQVLKTTLRSAFHQTQEQNIWKRQVDGRKLMTQKLPECLYLWPWCFLGKFHVRSVVMAFVACPVVFIDTKFHCDIICTINLAFLFTLFHNYSVRTYIQYSVGI